MDRHHLCADVVGYRATGRFNGAPRVILVAAGDGWLRRVRPCHESTSLPMAHADCLNHRFVECRKIAGLRFSGNQAFHLFWAIRDAC
jgi:hypothetical protein